jgi:mono/diheme cytochrome c family protein
MARAAFTIAMLAVMGFAITAQTQDFDAGKYEYQIGCAACHGVDGKGMGPVGALFGKPPANLTVLAKKNNGVFPFNYVYEVIDGRQVVLAHGTRDMPIWGNRYTPSPNRAASPTEGFVNPSYDPETIVRMRILAVMDYLNRIQEK